MKAVSWFLKPMLGVFGANLAFWYLSLPQLWFLIVDFIVILCAILYWYSQYRYQKKTKACKVFNFPQKDDEKNHVKDVKYFKKLKKKLKCYNSRTRKTVVIHGMPGVGKTQLALDFVHEYGRGYEQLAWFNAESLTSLKELYLQFGRKYQVWGSEHDTAENTDKNVEKVKYYFENNPNWLLVYDNANELDEFSQLIKLMPNQAGAILITSTTKREEFDHLHVECLKQKEAIHFLTTLSGFQGNRSFSRLAVLLGGL